MPTDIGLDGEAAGEHIAGGPEEPTSQLHCGKCNADKPSSAFNKAKQATRGHTWYCKECQSSWHAEWRESLRSEILDAYGGQCSLCGETTRVFLCLDHPNNNGHLERKQFGPHGVYVRAKRLGFPKGEYRLLCHNCNKISGKQAKRAAITTCDTGEQQETQRCSKCQATKPLELFVTDSTRKNGKKGICKECHAEYYIAIRKRLLAAYGNRCHCCGETREDCLEIDHINGGGRVEVAKVGGNRNLYLRLEKQGFPSDGYRLLCANCNWATWFCGTCPHQPTESNN